MFSNIKNFLHRLRAIAAVVYFRFPARDIKVIGVTGTDGKTTTATLIYHLLKSSGKKSALITTVAAYIGKKEIETGLHVTTPNPWVLQRLIKKAVEAGCEYLVLEVTSHGLDQHRVLGTNVSIAVLTNITHEHFDYHRTYDNYLKAKAKLLKSAKIAILNKEDGSYKILKRILNSKKVLTYGSKTLKGSIRKVVKRKLPEPYNRLNAAASFVAVRQLGVKDFDIKSGISSFPGVPGRMQEIKNRKGFNIIIDFAHTPNALENVLKFLRKKKKKGKIITVFGCAGERDTEKRSKMGEISAKFADISIFSAEDPRSENVDNIIFQMVTGAKKTNAREITKDKPELKKKVNYFIRVPERGEAVSFAIQKVAKKGDTIVICGKGCEKSMAYKDVEYPWSDFKAVDMALRGKVARIKRK